MSENCNHNCSSCGKNCDSRSMPQSFKIELNEYSKVKKVIGVISGKGGVGKSLVTSLLAAGLQRQGKRCGIIDADITGPSIPKLFGIKDKVKATKEGYLIPAVSQNGTSIISINVIIDEEQKPVIWRGPVITGTVKQFWSEVIWDDIDYMFVDMPPGTGDVPLTVYQSLPIDGVIMVTSPQDLVSMIVEKAIIMARTMDVPIVGLIENMSYYVCENCGEKHYIFGEGKLASLAEKYDIKNVARLPIDERIAKLCDMGRVEDINVSGLDAIIKSMEQM